MDRTSIHDFQTIHDQASSPPIDRRTQKSRTPEYANHHPVSSPVDFDSEDEADHSAPQSSSADEALSDNLSRHSSPRTSLQSEDDNISLILPDFQDDCSIAGGGGEGGADTKPSSPPCTPTKRRSAFRNPSSIRAMQMDTTPPHLRTPSSLQRTKSSNPLRNGTPQLARSYRGAVHSPSKLSPSKKVKKEYPLVLLHVTLLPLATDFSDEVMESVLPNYVLENWKLLREKGTPTVLERGILIPHPREDYDLLEERLLESLELKMPRILKCGHFHLGPEEEAELEAMGEDAYESDDDADICEDCGRRIRDGQLGSGTGNRRWDIKIYAANGLMRAGAWGAAWREMERVDVEIKPWISEDMRRELELRREEEERLAPQPDGQTAERASEEASAHVEGVAGLDDARLREIYGDDAQAYVDGLSDELPWTKSSEVPQPSSAGSAVQQDVPFLDLLKNLVYIAAQDRRNVAIFLLSMLVLLLSLRSTTESQALTASSNVVPPSIENFLELGRSTVDRGSSSISNAATPSSSSSQTMHPIERDGPRHPEETLGETAAESVMEFMEGMID